MTNDKHILMVSPTPTHPAISGNRRRVLELCRYLQQEGFVIHFVLYDVYNAGRKKADEASFKEMSETWDYFDFVPKSLESRSTTQVVRQWILKSRMYRRLAKQGFRIPIQYGIDDWCCDALLNFCRWKFENYPLSTVIVEYVFLSRVLDVVPAGAKKLIDTHDLFADRHQRLLKGGGAPTWFTTSATQENKGLARADVLIAIQESECKEFATRVDCPVIEVTHIESEHFLDRRYFRLETLGILGAWNYVNIDSFNAFIQTMENSGALDRITLIVAGDVCRNLNPRHPNVKLMGRTSSLESFYSSVDCVANPAITGTGLKIKSVEALAYGVPFISTACGSEGLPITEPYHAFDSISQLVDHVHSMVDQADSLEPYRQASIACFYAYRDRLRLQLEGLTQYLTA